MVKIMLLIACIVVSPCISIRVRATVCMCVEEEKERKKTQRK